MGKNEKTTKDEKETAGPCTSTVFCYICNSNKQVIPEGFYSMWYDGQQQHICSLSCRQAILDLCAKNQNKTYSARVVS